MEKGNIGYLGPKGTYSEIAADRLCGGMKKVAYPSFFTLFSALEKCEADAVVIPIENTLNGAVTQNLDLLQESENVYACAACAVKIDHRLITLAGADKSRIERVYSHGQALAQCGKFLAKNYPNARLCETPSTADSIKMICDERSAGIVGGHCRAAGFELSEKNISDVENNFTHFLLLRRGAPEGGVKSERIFFSFTCPHKVGALVDTLGLLKGNGINMTKIESRPIKTSAGEFRFFCEVEGDWSEDKLRAALKKVKEASSSFKLLGVY
ncbi:MAG: ACT domain-containing protein [Clostridiales bacterium]|nr:ACT domain-containing protein [Clostridiales bacterium]